MLRLYLNKFIDAPSGAVEDPENRGRPIGGRRAEAFHAERGRLPGVFRNRFGHHFLQRHAE